MLDYNVAHRPMPNLLAMHLLLKFSVGVRIKWRYRNCNNTLETNISRLRLESNYLPSLVGGSPPLLGHRLAHVAPHAAASAGFLEGPSPAWQMGRPPRADVTRLSSLTGSGWGSTDGHENYSLSTGSFTLAAFPYFHIRVFWCVYNCIYMTAISFTLSFLGVFW